MKCILFASIAALFFSSAQANQAKTEILCDTAVTAEEGQILHEKYSSLMQRGYVQQGKSFNRKHMRSYVGIGLKLKNDFDKSTDKTSGVIAVGRAVHESPAGKTGMFADAATVYRIEAVNGVSVSGLGAEVVQDMILGDKIAGSSVVITFSRYNSDRSFDRYFERARLSYRDMDLECQHFVLPKKK